MNGSEPAFPFPAQEGMIPHHLGMSARLYVATRAMEALLARSGLSFVFNGSGGPAINSFLVGGKDILADEIVSGMALRFADALIAACKETA